MGFVSQAGVSNILEVNSIQSRKTRRLDKLRQLDQPVANLYWRGRDFRGLIEKPSVAIVGSRHPSDYGIYVTEMLSRDLSRAGVTIISGLALGIDSIAHREVVNNGGHTIAVLPVGLDRIYPTRHRELADDILKCGGALISEYPDRSGPPMKYQFIARNRIIAGLADLVLVTEATERSGSLHTAYFGLNLGSDVLAVPGNINSPLSAGTNRLIQKGAVPVLSSQDVLGYLNDLKIS